MKRKSCSLRTLFWCVTQTVFVFALKQFASPVHLRNSERDTDFTFCNRCSSHSSVAETHERLSRLESENVAVHAIVFAADELR